MKRISLPSYIRQVVDDDPNSLSLEFATGEFGEARFTQYRANARTFGVHWTTGIWKLHDDGSEELVCTIGMMGLWRTTQLIIAFARAVFHERESKMRNNIRRAARKYPELEAHARHIGECGALCKAAKEASRNATAIAYEELRRAVAADHAAESFADVDDGKEA